jgi:hypothetical protein
MHQLEVAYSIAKNNQVIDGRNFKAKGVYDKSNCKDIRPSTYLSRKEMQSVFFTGQLAYNNNPSWMLQA